MYRYMIWLNYMLDILYMGIVSYTSNVSQMIVVDM